MKKTLSLVLAVALLLGALCTLIASAEGDDLFTFEVDKAEPVAGDTVKVTISANNAKIKSLGIDIDEMVGFEFSKGSWKSATFKVAAVEDPDPDEDSDWITPILADGMKANGEGGVDAAALTYAAGDDDTGEQVISGQIFNLTVKAVEAESQKLVLKVVYADVVDGEETNHTVLLNVFGGAEPVEESSEEEPAVTDPESYLILSYNGSNAQSGFQYKVDASLLNGKNFDIEALVYFGEDCAGDGSVFANVYPYDAEGALLNWNDYAKNTITEKGKWVKVTLQDWNPNKDDKTASYMTLGFGYYLATGTMKVAYVKVLVDGEEVFAKDMADFALDDPDIPYSVGMTAETKGDSWDLVGGKVPEESGEESSEEPGEESSEEPGEESSEEPGEESSEEAPFDFVDTASDAKVNEPVVGESVRIFTPDYDLAESNTKWSVNIVLNDLGDGRYEVVSVAAGSGDNFDGTLEAGQILLAVHSSTSDTEQAEQYPNVFGKLAAIELEEGDILDIAFNATDNSIASIVKEEAAPVEESEEESVEESQGAGEESSEEPGEESQGAGEESQGAPVEESKGSAQTGDAGIIALAIVSVLALGGAVVVKKSK